MNYNSLVFRKDMTGVDEYVKWANITSDLMRAYLYSKRSVIDEVSYIYYDGVFVNRIFSQMLIEISVSVKLI